MTLRYRIDEEDHEPAGDVAGEQKWRRYHQREEDRPPWAKDPDRWRRILAAAIETPKGLGDLHRAVRLEGEPNNLAKLRTLERVRELCTADRLAWVDHKYLTTGAGLRALAETDAKAA